MGSRANHKGTKSRLFKSAQISGSENSRMLERATQPYSLDEVGVHVRFIQAQDQQVLLHVCFDYSAYFYKLGISSEPRPLFNSIRKQY